MRRTQQSAWPARNVQAAQLKLFQQQTSMLQLPPPPAPAEAEERKTESILAGSSGNERCNNTLILRFKDMAATMGDKLVASHTSTAMVAHRSLTRGYHSTGVIIPSIVPLTVCYRCILPLFAGGAIAGTERMGVTAGIKIPSPIRY